MCAEQSTCKSAGPTIAKAILVDDRHIELYWDRQVLHADTPAAFEVRVDDCVVALHLWTPDEEWQVGTLYQKERMLTTLGLEEKLDFENTSKITVTPSTHIFDFYGNTYSGVRVVVEREPHYVQFYTSKVGLPVKAASDVHASSLKKAAAIVDIMLEKIPFVAKILVDEGFELVVYGLKKDAYDVLEHRMGYVLATRHVEGFGGCKENPTTSISESNLIRLRSGRYATSYPNEMILVHEFGHAIHLVGINNLEDQTLAKMVVDAYESAKEAGLWHDTYAISNYEEYFATLSTIWFNVMQEGIDGKWDGIRGPVNTRNELKEYDPQGYSMMEVIYTTTCLPTPWDYDLQNQFDIEGRPYLYNLDTDFNWDFIR